MKALMVALILLAFLGVLNEIAEEMRRRCGKDYAIVPVRLEAIEE
jgi:hypothetical protein